MIPHRLLWSSPSPERPRKTRAWHVLAFWCVLAFVVSFVLSCWVAA